MRWLLAQLDAYGTSSPGFNEGHYEDRCPVCERPSRDHFDRTRCRCGDVNYAHINAELGGRCDNCGCGEFRPRPGGGAKWPHRRAALVPVILINLHCLRWLS